MPRLISCMLAASVALSATRAAPYPRYYGHDVLDWPNDDRYSFRDSDYYHPSHHQRWQTHHHASDGYGHDSDPVLYEYIPRSGSSNSKWSFNLFGKKKEKIPKSALEEALEEHSKTRPSVLTDNDGEKSKKWAHQRKIIKTQPLVEEIKKAPSLKRKPSSSGWSDK